MKKEKKTFLKSCEWVLLKKLIYTTFNTNLFSLDYSAIVDCIKQVILKHFIQ